MNRSDIQWAVWMGGGYRRGQKPRGYDLYKVPADRNYTRDYDEGQPGFGGSPPEGLVYFPEALAFYLKHRPASRLLDPVRDDGLLGKVLSRVPHAQGKGQIECCSEAKFCACVY